MGHGIRAAEVALVVVALNLRITIAALSPVLGSVERTTGLTSTGGGVLTALPVVCFGGFALAAPRLIRRFDMGPLLAITMATVAAGAALRVVPSLAALFGGTAVIGAGIAVGNVVLPGLIKRDFSRQATLMTSLYSASLSVGAAFSAGLTVPIEHATGMGWRPAVGVWGAAALVAVAVWMPHARRRPAGAVAEPAGPVSLHALWSDRVAWAVTLFMGLQSFGYYAALSWIPTLLQAHHVAPAEAGWMLSFSAFPSMMAALATPVLVRRSRRPGLFVVATAGFCAAGYAGLIAAPATATYAWMTFLGAGQGIAISLALGYIVARAPDGHHVAHLSTMAQGVGYLIACTGPFLLGALHGLTGGWTVPLLVLVVALVPLLVSGLAACKDRYVLDPARRPEPTRLGA